MKMPKNIEVLFVAGFGPIVRDPAASRRFYSEALSLQFKEDATGYLYTGALDGVKHFALWPLAQVAESCFGMDQWPGDLPVPQAWIEFDVENIEKATAELKSQGYVGDCIWRWLMKKHKKLHRKRTRLVRMPSLLRPTRKLWRESLQGEWARRAPK